MPDRSFQLAFAALTAGLALAACATPHTDYAPAAGPGATGYRELRIEGDRYRVSFLANSDLQRPQVQDMAMRRAAEITLQNGGDWFRVVDRHIDFLGGHRGGDGQPHGDVGVASESGRHFSSTGVGVGLSFDFSPDTRRYESALEMIIGHGPKPADDPDTYDARELLSHLAPPPPPPR